MFSQQTIAFVIVALITVAGFLIKFMCDGGMSSEKTITEEPPAAEENPEKTDNEAEKTEKLPDADQSDLVVAA